MTISIKTYERKTLNYIYINQWEVQTLEKYLFNRLLNCSIPTAGLEVIYTSVNPTAVIYKVEK